MNSEDIGLGLHLCRQAGWNQLESDWRRFLSMQPQGCFVGELDGTPVATTTTCIFGSVAWIAMVLVEMSARRKGVATALLKHAMDYLDGQGVRSIRLDATAAGQPVYEKLGFVPEYRLSRYQGIAPQMKEPSEVTAASADRLREIVSLDRQMTGTHREKMLSRLFEESPQETQILCREDRLDGFVTVRQGFNATEIGPCVATPDAGPALLKAALGRCAGRPVFIDIPHDNAPAVALAETSGLGVQRDFMRMCRGERVRDVPAAIWASSGPEKG